MDNKNKVKFGLSNVHYAKMTIAEDGSITYAIPKKIPGGVSLSLDAQGDSSDFYADNVSYYNSYANNGYSGNLEIAQIPDEFRIDILGEKQDANGALIETGDAEISPFALMYQIEGDKTGTRFCYYNTTVSRPSSEANTIESSKTPNTDTLSITTSQRTTDKKVRAKLTLNDTNKTAYDAFYDSVYEEAESEAEGV